MTKADIKERVMQQAEVLYNLFPSNYNSDYDNYIISEDLWLTRTPAEYNEDQAAGVTIEDYRIWINAKYNRDGRENG